VFSPEQEGIITKARIDYDRRGHPEWVARLEHQLRSGVPFEDLNWPDQEPPPNISARKPIRPETGVDIDLLRIPPRYGKGSSTDNWREFAKLVLDMEHDLIDDLGRDDLINLIEDRDVIDPPPFDD
jgi:hypothetical protein